MRVAIGLLVLTYGCEKPEDKTFWRDRPDALVKSKVAGHAYTIQMPRNCEIRHGDQDETFFADHKPVITIEWTTPAAASKRVMQGAHATEIERLGIDGGDAPELVVKDINAVDEITLELAGPKVGFVTKLSVSGQYEIFAYLPSGLADGGFTCTSSRFDNRRGEAELKKDLDRLRGICLSLRTATKDAPSPPK
jgi:hypothetical protein